MLILVCFYSKANRHRLEATKLQFHVIYLTCRMNRKARRWPPPREKDLKSTSRSISPRLRRQREEEEEEEEEVQEEAEEEERLLRCEPKRHHHHHHHRSSTSRPTEPHYKQQHHMRHQQPADMELLPAKDASNVESRSRHTLPVEGDQDQTEVYHNRTTSQRDHNHHHHHRHHHHRRGTTDVQPDYAHHEQQDYELEHNEHNRQQRQSSQLRSHKQSHHYPQSHHNHYHYQGREREERERERDRCVETEEWTEDMYIHRWDGRCLILLCEMLATLYSGQHGFYFFIHSAALLPPLVHI